MNKYYVYILASGRNGTLYTGMTNDLCRRVEQHKSGVEGSFTKKYNVTKLVWFEVFNDVRYAIMNDKRIKKWNREWKLNLIERVNPNWDDLSINLYL